jgi:hypothetical protein
MNVNLVSELSRLELAKAFSKEARARYGDQIGRSSFTDPLPGVRMGRILISIFS